MWPACGSDLKSMTGRSLLFIKAICFLRGREGISHKDGGKFARIFDNEIEEACKKSKSFLAGCKTAAESRATCTGLELNRTKKIQ